MDTLPTLRLTLRLPDPDWVAEFVEGENRAINSDTYAKDFEVEVEVVQLNINAGTMRIRYPWPNKHRKTGMEVCSQDVSINKFFDKFDIVAK